MKPSCAKFAWLFGLMICGSGLARAEDTNSLVWLADRNLVSADIRGEALWPLLEDIARQTGWHIFVEPGANLTASVKFRDVPEGEALQKLLGNLNFALVPETNGPEQLYVFQTTIQNATRRVAAPKPRSGAMAHVANQLLVKVKPGTDIEALARRGAPGSCPAMIKWAFICSSFPTPTPPTMPSPA